MLQLRRKILQTAVPSLAWRTKAAQMCHIKFPRQIRGLLGARLKTAPHWDFNFRIYNYLALVPIGIYRAKVQYETQISYVAFSTKI